MQEAQISDLFLAEITYFFSDDCDVLLTALRYGINKDSDDPKDWNDGTIEENTNEMSTYYRSIILAGPSEKGQALLEKVNNGEELTWDDLTTLPGLLWDRLLLPVIFIQAYG